MEQRGLLAVPSTSRSSSMSRRFRPRRLSPGPRSRCPLSSRRWPSRRSPTRTTSSRWPRAPRLHGTLMCLSTVATATPSDVAAAAPGALRWLQIYVFRDREVGDVIAQSLESGFSALVLTADLPSTSGTEKPGSASRLPRRTFRQSVARVHAVRWTSITPRPARVRAAVGLRHRAS